MTVNIKAAVEGQVAALNEAGIEVSDFNKGNIKARQRMITQYACLLYTSKEPWS